MPPAIGSMRPRSADERRDGFLLVGGVDVSEGLQFVPPARSSSVRSLSGVIGMLPQRHAGRVADRVGDRRGGGHRRRLADADHAALG